MSLKQAFSIQEFCEVHSLSRAKFYLLLKENLAPKLMRVGRRRLISNEAAAEWRKKMESETEKKC
jgi:hypothetical protein